MDECEVWAVDEFSGAALGDARRSRRLVALAAAFARRPRGRVTQVFDELASREGAFRFLENESVSAEAIASASHAATARRCANDARILVAVDQATLTLTDRLGKPGFGRTGPSAGSTTTGGFQVMTALVVRCDRTVEGVLGQQWWSRQEKAPPTKQDRRPNSQRESSLWKRTIEQAETTLAANTPNTRAWYQLDRGGDAAAVLEYAVDAQVNITVRSAHDRALGNGERLRASIQRKAAMGTYRIRPREATRNVQDRVLAVRSAQVVLRLNDLKGRTKRTIALWCVHVREQRPRRGSERLEWWLLTTVPVRTFKDALAVVSNYTARWRIEEFHRAWKSGVCNIEHSQLRTADRFQRWATIGAAVAARAERLKTAARAAPQRVANEELSRDEIDAAILLTKRCRYERGDVLTMEQAIRLIADIGGYTGKSSGGPPGVRVIQRGLEEVIVAAKVLEALRRSD